MISNTLPQSLIDNPILSQWIAFEEKGRVRVGSGKVEIGQGILTALTQIAAEELDVRPEQINLVSGQTDVSPAEGFTSGSYSIAVGGASIRLVCAEVRSLFLDRVAEALRCPVGELSIEDGKFLRAGKDTGHDYWSMAGEITLDRRATGTAPIKRPSTYKIVGKHLPRLDLPAKVTGARLHPRHRARERAARPRAAPALARRASRGARRERGAQGRQHADRHHPRGRVRRLHRRQRARGDARVGGRAHAAPNGKAARRRPPTSARRPGSRRRPRATRPPTPASPAARRPAARSRPPIRGPFLTYGSIATSCALAEFKDGALKVWSHSQGPAVLRDWLARALGLPAAQVNVFHRQGAGAYGHNTADDAAFDASFIAMRHPGRTVRVQWSREDEFAAAPISTAMAITLRAVLDADNKPADWQIEIWSPPHAQRPGMNGNSNLLGAAALPNAPPLNPLSDVPDERGGGATRNAVAIYDLPRHRLIHHLLPRGADPHLVAARARRLGQCVRHRILHRRTGRDRRRRPGQLPAVAALRSAPPPRGRDRGAHERLVRAAQSARRPRPRLRLRPLQEHRLVRRRGGRARSRRRDQPEEGLVRGRRRPRHRAGRRAATRSKAASSRAPAS